MGKKKANTTIGAINQNKIGIYIQIHHYNIIFKHYYKFYDLFNIRFM